MAESLVRTQLDYRSSLYEGMYMFHVYLQAILLAAPWRRREQVMLLWRIEWGSAADEQDYHPERPT